MRAVVQRVSRAQVLVGEEPSASIGRGLLVLLGIGAEDEEADARHLAERVASLRIFEDPDGKMNLALPDVGGEALVVSNFTLFGDCRKGRRPSFTGAAPPEKAEALYLAFADCLRNAGIPVSTGSFRAKMQVELTNDGPVTILLDSKKLF